MHEVILLLFIILFLSRRVIVILFPSPFPGESILAATTRIAAVGPVYYGNVTLWEERVEGNVKSFKISIKLNILL